MRKTLLLLPALALAVLAPARAVPVSAAANCASRVAVLGVDMSAGGRFEVQRALAVGPHTTQLDETMAAERAAAHGLVPPELLGVEAVSSAVLRPLPAGSGLTVRLNPAITLDTAQTYANALLTAGVTDADVGVAAPTSQQAWGTTAMLGLLRAAQATCLSIDPARRDLAIREVVLTGQLARLIGRQAAPSLLFTLKADAVSKRVDSTNGLSALVTRDAGTANVAVPAVYRPALLAFLHDLVASGSYARIAAAHPTLSTSGLLQSTVRLGAAAAPRAPARTPAAPAVVSHAGAWHGIVTAAGARGLTARLAGGPRTYTLAPAMQVYRNGQLSSVAALRAGDAVTVTTNAAGVATLVQASGPAVVAPVAAPAINAGAIAGLALLVLLALLLIPFLVGWLRRRTPARRRAARRAGAATQLFTVTPRDHDPEP